MRECVMYYYKEPIIDILHRNWVTILSIVTVCFVSTVLLIVEHGSMEIEKWELWLKEQEAAMYIPLEYEGIHTEETQKTTAEETQSKTQKFTTIAKSEVVEMGEIAEEVEVTEESIEEVIDVVESINYYPTEMEREYAYKVAFGEASTQSSMSQTLVINVAINNMRNKGYANLIQEFEVPGRYSCIENGEVYNSGKVIEVSDVPQSVKDAVDAAFAYDYSEQMLKEEANRLGITDEKYWKGGATYFYNPELCSENQNNLRQNIKVKFRYDEHIFYCYWDK